ncbi:FKBP-type peptidyl-prolyl cis-trans isomerase [Hymenobacter koreensis]
MRTLSLLSLPSFGRLRGLLALLLPLLLLTAACKKDDAFSAQIEAQKKLDDEAIREYLTKNNITTFEKTESGLYLVFTKDEPGVLIRAGNSVQAKYIGRFLDGRVFDSSYDNNLLCQCFSFRVGQSPLQVIQGWDEGFRLMNKGDEVKLLVPSYMAYGTRGGGSIGPNTPIQFDIVVTDVR